MVEKASLAVVSALLLVLVSVPASAGDEGLEHCDEVTLDAFEVEEYYVRSGVEMEHSGSNGGGEGSGSFVGPVGVWEETNGLTGLQVEDCFVWADKEETTKDVVSADARVAGSMDVNEAYEDAVDEVNGASDEAIDAVNEAYDEAWDDVSEAYDQAWDAVSEAYDDAWEDASNIVDDTWETVTWLIDNLW